jgi:hypothetical protein
MICTSSRFLFDSESLTTPFVESGAFGPAFNKKCGETLFVSRNQKKYGTLRGFFRLADVLRNKEIQENRLGFAL